MAWNFVGPSALQLKSLRFYFPLSSGTKLWGFSLRKHSLLPPLPQTQTASHLFSFSPGPSPSRGHTWPGVCCSPRLCRTTQSIQLIHLLKRLSALTNVLFFFFSFHPQPLIPLSSSFLIPMCTLFSSAIDLGRLPISFWNWDFFTLRFNPKWQCLLILFHCFWMISKKVRERY